MSTTDRKGIGTFGEAAAISLLAEKGYRILEQNFRFGRYGEVDIVAQTGNILCFIEVKTREHTYFGTAAEAVTYKKRQRIIRVANYYITVHQHLKTVRREMPTIRFDVIEVYIDKIRDSRQTYESSTADNGNPDTLLVRSINHIENAFTI